MMQTFDDEWDRTQVEVVSPNEQVFVTVHGNRSVAVSMAPGYYERASRAQLEEQLARTAKLAFVRRTQAFFRLRSQLAGEDLRPGHEVHSTQDAAYRRGLDELAVEGESADTTVRMMSVGMSQFGVTIAPGVLERLDAGSFARSVSEAATRLLQDQLDKALDLRFEVYYPD